MSLAREHGATHNYILCIVFVLVWFWWYTCTCIWKFHIILPYSTLNTRTNHAARARTKEDLWIYFDRKPLSHQSGVLTAFKKCRTPRCALCKRQQRCVNAVQSPRTPYGGVYFEHAQNKRRGLAFPSVLDSMKENVMDAVKTLWERRVDAVGTLWGRCVDAITDKFDIFRCNPRRSHSALTWF